MKVLLVILLTFMFLTYDCYAVVIDSLGKKFEQKRYTRVISLAPSITETLFFMGLGDRLIGVTRYCGVEREIVGGIYDPDLEKIIKLKPDLVLMLKMGSYENYEYLVRRGVKVFVLDYKRVDDIVDNMFKLSRLLKGEEKEEIIRSFRYSFYASVRNAIQFAKGKRFFFLYSYPLIYTASSNSYASDIVRRIGGINVVDHLKSPYQTLTVGVETLLKLSPDIIVLSTENNKLIEEELRNLGLNSTFISVDPMEISPSVRITNFLLKLISNLKSPVVPSR
ncbi:MAG: helical backbone metal receptor [Spirochaetia bacterium]|nr:helical backbone metal receptor [Spirochaetota bacterium]MCX8097025.1 helical backbone metal receptor [Spirochaetota bacterium]MDW8111892.1 helical backbone metal receptor [Spirochaetia bacterium]